MVKSLEVSHASALTWLVGMPWAAMLLLMLHRVSILLSIPVR